MKVYFSHGKESGPWGSKIRALADVARDLGCAVASVDYTQEPDPDQRVNQLLELLKRERDDYVLVGSSMGGYVSLIAAAMAPAKALLLWFGFALVYFGFLLPNTYYAKLGLDASQSTIATMGAAYLGVSALEDPLTLLVIAAAVAYAASVPAAFAGVAGRYQLEVRREHTSMARAGQHDAAVFEHQRRGRQH